MKKLLLLFVLSLILSMSWGQHNVNLIDTAYTQDFDSLTSGTWSNGATLSGWYARTTATASITAYGANTGATTTAGLYAFGIAGTNPLSDRALGYAPSNGYTGSSGSGKGFLGWRLKNNTGATISSISVTWSGEQWRVNGNTATHMLVLSYQTGVSVSDLVAGTWTTTSSSFTSPITAGTTALDGNAPANKVSGINVVLNNLNLADGSEIMLRWEDLNDSGNDHFLAIDDVSITASADEEEAPTIQTTLLSYSNILQNQMDVAWTNGDGAKRVVIMNTSNSFTNPADGTDPTANPIYGGAGEQVVYNGSGSSLTVTGLLASTTYWFRAYEYNGAGANTLYLTSTATGNPNSQQTSAPAPLITVDPTSLTGFRYILGYGPSTAQSFTISGENLTGDITITAPTFFEISETEDGVYESPIVLGQTRGSVPETPIFVRLKANLTNATYSQSVTATSPGAANKSVTTSGQVYKPLVTVIPSTLSGFAYGVGQGPSSPMSFNISGTNLADDIDIAAPTNYEISTAVDGIYGSTASLSPVSETVTSTPIYTRLKAGLAEGSYDSEVITASTPQGDDKTVTCNGSVFAPGYYVNFEGVGETKTSYATGTVSLSGMDWDMTESLIGDLAADFKIGARSARMRGYAASSMTMLEDKTTGLGTLSFKYRRYGADTQVDWKAEYSTDQGTNWTQIGSSFTAPASDEVQTFSEVLDIAGNVRVRIKRATETGASNARLNIDDIALTDYAAPYDYPEDTPVAVGDITVLVEGGNANNDDQGTIPEFNNPGFTPDQTLILTLLGTGPWTITITTTSQWGAFYQNGTWLAAQNQNGTIVFGVSEGTKDIPTLPIILGPVDPTLPIELSSFSATINAQNYVSLMWVTQSETGVQGYYIYRAMNGNIGEAQMVSTMITATNTSSQQTYMFVDSDLYDEGTYYYWLQNVDFDGGNAFHGPVTVYFTLGGGGNDTPNIPLVTDLTAIYPNPFNPSAFISYDLATNAKVSFRIYNSRGQLVRNIEPGTQIPGRHRVEWNGRDDQGNACSTGIYFIRMQAGKDSFVRKAVMIK